MNHGSDLIDTGEMFLKTVLEFEEEGVVALRARIGERLGQTAPSVSQTVAKMERDGQLALTATRRVRLTAPGRLAAVRVMRKHRLAECLLADVLGMEWPLLHNEACRWEHVMSEAVERRLAEILGHPAYSPYGNPIPGLAELGGGSAPPAEPALPGELLTLSEAAQQGARVVVRRITEQLQSDTDVLTRLDRAGARPSALVAVSRTDGRVLIGAGDQQAELDHAVAAKIRVTLS